MKQEIKLVTSDKKEQYNGNEIRWRSDSGNMLHVSHEVRFEVEKVNAQLHSLWRYRHMIPIQNDDHIVSFEEGFTPLLKTDLWGKNVFVKQEQLFSTGSYKDRGATVLMSKAKELGVKHVVQDSSGNAGCAVAAYAAAAGIGCDIYVPASTSPAKLVQIQKYGATLKLIEGTREDTARAALQAAAQHYYASHCWNPFFFEGTKTFAYEVCEQLKWKAPDVVVIPAGNGTLLIGCYIGFKELLESGIIDKMPKLIAVQAQNCAPLYHAFHHTNEKIILQPTVAEGIAIAQPIRAAQMIEAVKDSEGDFIVVTEDEIREAWNYCCSKGFYIEPTSAATIAGVKKYMEEKESGLIVSLFTGHGLKAQLY